MISMGQGQLSEWPKQRKDYFEVYVSAVEHPGHFWVQVISPESVRLDTLIQDMNKYYSVQPKVCHDFPVNDHNFCLAVNIKVYMLQRICVISECAYTLKILGSMHFYCVNTSYPMDNSLSGRRRPARQTSEKDVLCLHQQVGPEYQCTRQMACRTSFLSRQSDVIASFSFGANQCTVENLYLPEFVFYQCLL